LICLCISSNTFPQGIPQTINYQGLLKDAAGVVVPNGDYSLTFKLYDAESGGTVLWNETKIINVVGGIINTQLGSVTPIPSAAFVGMTWLGITIGAGSELTPRITLTSVPYSFMSMNLPDGSITATKIADAQVVKSLNGLKDNINLVAGTNVTLTPSANDIIISSTGGGSGIGGSGTANYLPKFSNSTTLENSKISEVFGNIGIDETSPNYKLTLNTTGSAGLGLKIHRSGGTNLLIKNDGSSVDQKGWAFNVFNTKLQIRTIADDDLTTLMNVMTFQRDGYIGIGTITPVSALDVTGTVTLSGSNNELNRTQTSDANLLPIAYANVNSDGTLNMVATTSNVSLASHSAGSGNYYFVIADVNVSYLTTVCVATLNSTTGGEISWNSLGGGDNLGIYTRSSSGTALDKAFTFVVYKK
jgi:hypothetical protein